MADAYNAEEWKKRMRGAGFAQKVDEAEQRRSKVAQQVQGRESPASFDLLQAVRNKFSNLKQGEADVQNERERARIDKLNRK